MEPPGTQEPGPPPPRPTQDHGSRDAGRRRMLGGVWGTASLPWAALRATLPPSHRLRAGPRPRPRRRPPESPPAPPLRSPAAEGPRAPRTSTRPPRRLLPQCRCRTPPPSCPGCPWFALESRRPAWPASSSTRPRPRPFAPPKPEVPARPPRPASGDWQPRRPMRIDRRRRAFSPRSHPALRPACGAVARSQVSRHLGRGLAGCLRGWPVMERRCAAERGGAAGWEARKPPGAPEAGCVTAPRSWRIHLDLFAAWRLLRTSSCSCGIARRGAFSLPSFSNGNSLCCQALASNS